MGSILVIVSRDTVAPSIPGQPSQDAITQTTASISWAASTDSGGSGLKGYDIEQDGVVVVTDQPTTTYTASGLSSGQTVTFRVRARDNAGNVSAFSSSRAVTTVGNLAPSWLQTPAPQFTQGAAASISLVPSYVADPEGDTITLSLLAGTLPTGVTLNNTTKSIDYNGTSPVASAAGIRIRATATGGTGDSAAFSVSIAAAGAASDVTTLTVEGSGTQFVTFAHVIAKGDISAALSAVITNTSNVAVPNQQTTKLATHADGTLRHALISAELTGGQTYKVRAATAITGTARSITDLLAAIPGDIASITLSGGISGTAVLRDLLSSATNRASGGLQTIAAGPTCLELVVARDLGTQIRCTFNVRWYGGTNLWVDYIFENGYGNVNGQGDKSYAATLVLNGSTVYSTGTITHWNHTSWHRPFWSSGGTLYVKHNATYLTNTGAVPKYQANSGPSAPRLAALVTASPAPMTASPISYSVPAYINGGGGSEHIGLLPNWDSQLIASGMDSRAFRAGLATHDCYGLYAMTMMSNASGDHMRVWEFPNASIAGDPAYPGFGTGAGSTSNPYKVQVGYTEASHGCAAGYLPYVLTGNYFYLRLLTAWACHHTLYDSGAGWNYTYNDGAGSMTYRLVPGQGSQPGVAQLRTYAWSLRTWGIAGYILPDGHHHKRYLRGTFGAQLDKLLKDYVSPGTLRNNLGCIHDGEPEYSHFMHNFMVAVLGWMSLDLDYPAALPLAKYAATLTAGLLGNTTEYPFEFAPLYRGYVAASGINTYSTFTQVLNDSRNLAYASRATDSGTTAKAAAVKAVDNNARNVRNETLGQSSQFFSQPDGYYANMLPAASYLERLEIPGGWACNARLYASGESPNWVADNMNVWAICARRKPLPTWCTAPINQWQLIPNSSLNGFPPGTTFYGYEEAKIEAWCGAALRAMGSKYYLLAGGGHSDGSDNGVYEFDAGSNSPQWRRVRTGSATPTRGVTHYADGRPASRHSGWRNFWLDGRDLGVLFGCYASWDGTGSPQGPAGTGGGPHIDAYDPSYNGGDYRPSGFFANGPNLLGGSTSQYAAIAKSWLTENVYWINDTDTGVVHRWKPTGAGSTAVIGGTGQYETIYKAAAFDHKRGRMLVTTGYQESVPSLNEWYRVNIDGTATKTAVSMPAAQLTGTASLVYDPHGDRFLWSVNASTVYSINAETFAVTNLNLTAGANGVPTRSGNDAGLYNRMHYAPELGGLIVMAAHDQGVYFCKLHDLNTLAF